MADIVTLQPTWLEAKAQFGRRYWMSVVASCGPSVVIMAARTGMNRIDVYKCLARYQVELPRGGPALMWKEAYTAFGHKYWSAAMAVCDASVSKMGRLTATNRQDVYKKLKRFGVQLPVNTKRGHRGNWGDLSNEEPKRLTA